MLNLKKKREKQNKKKRKKLTNRRWMNISPNLPTRHLLQEDQQLFTKKKSNQNLQKMLLLPDPRVSYLVLQE
jgi:hypothetical protein